MKAAAWRRQLARARIAAATCGERRHPWAPRDEAGKSPARRTPRQVEKPIQAAITHLLGMLGARVYVLGTRRKRGDHQGTRQTPGLP